MKHNALFAFLLGLAVLLVSFSASAQVMTSRLQFVYNGEQGLVFVTSTLDTRPKASCRVTIVAGIHYEGDQVVQATRTVLNGFKAGRRRGISVAVTGLPSVATSSTGQRPVLTIQTQTNCGQSVVVSNPIARYVLCGTSSNDVTPASFLGRLRSKIRNAAKANRI